MSAGKALTFVVFMMHILAAAWTGIAGISPTVADATAQQRYPWNGKVDITCSVSGIDSATNTFKFAMAAVMPDSGEVREVSHFWVVRDGTNSTDLVVHTNGDYRLVWDARADIVAGCYSNMVVRITLDEVLADTRAKVQLWENGPYWATTNIGAENPWDSGYYFWWGDTVGYKRENDAWVASDGSTSNFLFVGSNTPTYNKSIAVLQSEGWITADDVLTPWHDAAQVQWGGDWRTPTYQKLADLNNNCDWTWTTTNGVNGYIVRGRGDYASVSIFLPASGFGYGTSLRRVGSDGGYWSSVPFSDSDCSWYLYFDSDYCSTDYYCCRYFGQVVRPVQGFTIGADGADSAPFLLNLLNLGPEAPMFSPASGTTFESSLTVTISCPTEGAEIYYTTDGSEPTKDSTAYKRFKIYGKTTIKAVAYDAESGLYSEVVTAEYALGRCATPEITAATTFTGSRTKCEIACETEGATIYYTLDGSTPTRYAGAFYISESCTVKAIALLNDYLNSEVAVKTITKEWGIGDTMGAPDHAFTTSGDNDQAFYRVDDASAPNGEAMHSGDIGNSGAYGSFARTVLATTVMGPGTVSFSWKASCEDDAPDYEWDHGEFAVDGVVQAYISGVTGWTNVSVSVAGDGEHTLTWTYLKDDAASEGEDCIWVAGYGWESAWTATRTTNVPVSYAWLRSHDPEMVDEYDAYEAAAKETAANGYKVWECFAMGFDPTDPLDDFRITAFWMDGDMPMFEFNHTEDGDGNSFLHLIKPLGKAKLEDAWQHVPEGGDPSFRFFAAEVVLPGGESIVKELVGVQLWENGPCWAECNVGASKPEEYGYYFWWGDTVGYTNTESGWISVKDGTSISLATSGTAASTYRKDNSELQSAGYIDSTGNLVAAHDAATAHLGSPWRMPTKQELYDLNSKCDWTWTTKNGVNGYIVCGRGDYASASIFLPAAGYGSGISLYDVGSTGFYWSSVPDSGNGYDAWYLDFNSSDHYVLSYYYRYFGQSVRPVRGFTK